MIINRKIQEDAKERLEDLIDDAEQYGYKFIELRLGSRSPYIEVIMGVEEAKVRYGRAYGETVASASNVVIVKDGILNFYPDSKGFNWGYMVDTESNRRWLAAQLKDGVVTIADNTTLNEVKEIAKANGFPTEFQAVDHSIDAGLTVSVKEVEKKDSEIEELKAQLAALQAAKDAKPLSGKKITKK